MKQGDIRFTRLDANSYKMEVADYCTDKEKTKRYIDWVFDGYYSTVESMLRSALKRGIGGTNVKEAIESIKDAEYRVLSAFYSALDEGRLVENAEESEKRKEQARANAAKRKKDKDLFDAALLGAN